MSKEVKVAELPMCDVCRAEGLRTVAAYDAALKFGSWGYVCEAHFKRYGRGLGTGLGQRLVKQEKPK